MATEVSNRSVKSDDSWPPLIEQQIAAALLVGTIPEAHWVQGDDQCDCTFQRIGFWSNPYIQATEEYRLCCMWKRIIEALGLQAFVREIPASFDLNRYRYVTEARDWDREDAPMPLTLWHRQLAARTGLSLAQVREQYAGREHERPQPLPPGTAVKDVPTPEELHAAREAELRAATWILDDERLA
jgi:hypothetical protein